eukprot:jgi/Botrbrau1/22797/Bobra.0132s0123.1
MESRNVHLQIRLLCKQFVVSALRCGLSVVLLWGGRLICFSGISVCRQRQVSTKRPRGPFFFLLWRFTPFILSLAERFEGVLQGWYLDDGSVIGDTRVLHGYLEQGTFYSVIGDTRVLRGYLEVVLSLAKGPQWGIVLNLRNSSSGGHHLILAGRVGFPEEPFQNREFLVRLLGGPLSASRVFVSDFCRGLRLLRLAKLWSTSYYWTTRRWSSCCSVLDGLVHDASIYTIWCMSCAVPLSSPCGCGGVAVFDDALYRNILPGGPHRK